MPIRHRGWRLVAFAAGVLLIASSARAQIPADTEISRVEGPGSLTLRATQSGVPQAPQQQNNGPAPTLVVTKTAVPTQPEIGGIVHYIFAVTNVGAIPGTNVLIQDPDIIAAVEAGQLQFADVAFVQIPDDGVSATIRYSFNPGPPPEADFGGIIENLSPGATFAFQLGFRVVGFGPAQTFTNVATAKNCGHPMDDELTTAPLPPPPDPCTQVPVIAVSEPVTVRFRVATPVMGLAAAAVVAAGLSALGVRRLRRRARR